MTSVLSHELTSQITCSLKFFHYGNLKCVMNGKFAKNGKLQQTWASNQKEVPLNIWQR